MSVDVVLAIVEGLKAGEAMYELANKPRKRELRGPVYELGNKPRKRATKPVPVETPEEAEAKEVKRRMAEEERRRSNDEFLAQLRVKPATQEDAALENAQRIIIAAARYTE